MLLEKGGDEEEPEKQMTYKYYQGYIIYTLTSVIPFFFF